MHRLRFLSAICLASVLGFGCGGGDDDSTLSLELTNVPDLGDDYVYEGWLITSDGPVSTGRFSVTGSGALDPATFPIAADVLEDSSKFVLTIEPAVGDDPAPADVHILAGDLANQAADLTTSDPAAIGTDFSGAAAAYILATPTTGADDTDNNQGIWWLMPGEPLQPSMTLPALPAGWAYEGWVVGGDGPVSTGRFPAADVEDSDAAGATAGPDGSPPFPGQDFINPAVDLVGQTAVISVEPDPDNSPAPFIMKPLIDMEIEAVAAPATQAMANVAGDTLPSGSVSIQ